jgi:hypothetical protein
MPVHVRKNHHRKIGYAGSYTSGWELRSQRLTASAVAEGASPVIAAAVQAFPFATVIAASRLPWLPCEPSRIRMLDTTARPARRDKGFSLRPQFIL